MARARPPAPPRHTLSDVYCTHAASVGGRCDPGGLRALLRRPGGRRWLREEASRQGRDQARAIPASMRDACRHMFRWLPPPGNKYETLWRLVLATARRAGLRDRLDVARLRPGHLALIARAIDRWFVRGTLLPYIARMHRPLTFAIAEAPDAREPDAAMYLDAVPNRVVLVRPTWRRRMPRATSMDGVRVRSKLEWLCHMTAHEMCHSLANVACSVGCARLARNHGPVFRRLNHSIFGHPGDS